MERVALLRRREAGASAAGAAAGGTGAGAAGAGREAACGVGGSGVVVIEMSESQRCPRAVAAFVRVRALAGFGTLFSRPNLGRSTFTQ